MRFVAAPSVMLVLFVGAALAQLPPWWETISKDFEGINLSRCSKRKDAPRNGTSCSKKPKTCYFGNMPCPEVGPYPETECFCNGDGAKKGFWNCKSVTCPDFSNPPSGVPSWHPTATDIPITVHPTDVPSTSPSYPTDVPSTSPTTCLPCPEDSHLNLEGFACVRTERVGGLVKEDRDFPLVACQGNKSPFFGSKGAIFPEQGIEVKNTFFGGVVNFGTDGRLNAIGIWACQEDGFLASQSEPRDTYFGLSACLDVPEGADYSYVLGVAANNRARVFVDGNPTPFFELGGRSNDNSNSWWMRPIHLAAGFHIIEIDGYTDRHIGAAFGAEIYGPYPRFDSAIEGADLAAFDYQNNIVWSTGDQIGRSLMTGGCPKDSSPVAIDSCDRDGNPQCTKFIEEDLQDCACPPCPEENSHLNLAGTACDRHERVGGPVLNDLPFPLVACKATKSIAYGAKGAIFSRGWVVKDAFFGDNSNVADGRLNEIGVWACGEDGLVSNGEPFDVYLPLSACLQVPKAASYVLGVAADNQVRVRIDGTPVFELDGGSTDNFDFWWMRPITLSAGFHIVEIKGLNNGISGLGAVGAEIYGPFPQFSSILNDEDLIGLDYENNIVWSTGDQLGRRLISGFCPDSVSPVAIDSCVPDAGPRCTRFIEEEIQDCRPSQVPSMTPSLIIGETDGPASGETSLCDCPDGFSKTPDEQGCELLESVDATFNGQELTVCYGDDLVEYGTYGATFPGKTRLQNLFFGRDNNMVDGRLNDIGAWACEDGIRDQWFGFSHCFQVQEDAEYVVGIAGDNGVRFRLDGRPFSQLLGDSSPFRSWWMVPISLKSGTHIIEIEGLDQGRDAAFGGEIYGPFPLGSTDSDEKLIAIEQGDKDYRQRIVWTSESELNRGSKFVTGQLNGYSCPAGSAVDKCNRRTGRTVQCTTFRYEECDPIPIVVPTDDVPIILLSPTPIDAVPLSPAPTPTGNDASN